MNLRPDSSLQVQEIMSVNPVCCTKETPLEEVAHLMKEHRCGEIPVVDLGGTQPIGVITDRDIVCRTLAVGVSPLGRSAESCMSHPVHVLRYSASLEECLNLMEKYQIRRVPIVDEKGNLCGIISQADIARKLSRDQVSLLIREQKEKTRASGPLKRVA